MMTINDMAAEAFSHGQQDGQTHVGKRGAKIGIVAAG